MKINKYYISAPGLDYRGRSYEEEIFAGVNRTCISWFDCPRSIALAILLTVILSRFLTRPITELTEITARMAGGDLTKKSL